MVIKKIKIIEKKTDFRSTLNQGNLAHLRSTCLYFCNSLTRICQYIHTFRTQGYTSGNGWLVKISHERHYSRSREVSRRKVGRVCENYLLLPGPTSVCLGRFPEHIACNIEQAILFYCSFVLVHHFSQLLLKEQLSHNTLYYESDDYDDD